MKPRERWIIGSEAYQCEQLNNAPLSFHAEQIHMREVVPIDWDKIWIEAKSEGHIINRFMFNHIQQLVEAQLKGED